MEDNVRARMGRVMKAMKLKVDELKAMNKKYPCYVDGLTEYHVMEFWFKAMQLAPEAGRMFIAEEIGLGVGGSGLEFETCLSRMLELGDLLRDVVQQRFSRNQTAELKVQIQEHHKNCCYLTDKALTEEFIPAPTRYSPDGETPLAAPRSDSHKFRILPLATFLLDPVANKKFWRLVGSIMGHSEWEEKYGNATAPDEDLTHFLLLQKSVATEFSRLKIAVQPPKAADERKCNIERNSVNTPDRSPRKLGGLLSMIDTHTPRDSILKKIPSSISRDNFNKCDKDLLELHFFLFSLFKNARQGHLWISEVEWNSLDATDLVDEVESDVHSREPLSDADFAFLEASISDEEEYEAEQARRLARHEPALGFTAFFGKDIF